MIVRVMVLFQINSIQSSLKSLPSKVKVSHIHSRAHGRKYCKDYLKSKKLPLPNEFISRPFAYEDCETQEKILQISRNLMSISEDHL